MTEITELRVGNLLIYEACAYEVMGINVIETPKLNVKAVNHEWGVERCGENIIKKRRRRDTNSQKRYEW